MNSEPFFSIVVPTYNRVSRLITTLTSILEQTFTGFELIVVDDGSTDGTAKIITEKFNDSRIRIITQKNSERGAARNNGLKNAKGIYVVFFDSDDIMHKNHLEVLHKNILAENSPAFIANKFDFVREDNSHHPSDINSIKKGYYDYRLFLNGNPLACNICVRKDAPGLILFEEDRKYSIKEDWLFLICNMKIHKLYITDDVTISMLDHADRSMRSDNSVIILRTGLAMEWILKKMDLGKSEVEKLKAHVNYFCGIHSYLDNNRSASVKYSVSAIRHGGIKMKYISLLLKSVIGRKLIASFR